MAVLYRLPSNLGYVYSKVADHIEQRIRAGELPPRAPLPSERRLAEQYGVSLGTARRATQILRDRGLVTTIPALGTFVSEAPSPGSEGGRPASYSDGGRATPSE